MFKTAAILFILLVNSLISGERYFTRTGYIHFISHTDIIDIAGENNDVGSIIDIGTGEVVFTVLMKSFKFNQALAEEHFNENYVESDIYPKAKFRGKILDLDKFDLNGTGKHKVFVEGSLTIHGVTNRIKTSATMEFKEGRLYAESGFSILPADYNIGIPDVVKDKVAEIIPIKVKMIYEPYGK